jgi:hypothetical protein
VTSSPPGQDRPLVFDWGDGSPDSYAALDEVLTHTYPGPGTYLITVTWAATDLIAWTTYAYVASDDIPELIVPDSTLHTCQLESFTSTLTNGFGEVQQVYSYTTLLGANLTPANTLYQRDYGNGAETLPLTAIPGGVQAISSPFTIERDQDAPVTILIRLPSTATGTINGHVDYVTSTVEDDEGNLSINTLIGQDFVITVADGDCSNPPAPGTCSISDIVPEVNQPVFDDDGTQTGTTSTEVGTAQSVMITGLGLAASTAMIVVTDDNEGFPLQYVTYAETTDPDTGDDIQTVSGVIGLLPCIVDAHIKSVVVQDQLNTTRCSITVDWHYTPTPIPDLGLVTDDDSEVSP